MGDDKSPLSPMGDRDRDRELLIPVSGGGSAPGDGDEDGDRATSSSASAALSSSGREIWQLFVLLKLEQLMLIFLFLFSAIQTFHKVVRSWASKKFMTGWFFSNWKYNDLLDKSFYIVGGIEEVIAEVEKIAKKSAS